MSEPSRTNTSMVNGLRRIAIGAILLSLFAPWFRFSDGGTFTGWHTAWMSLLPGDWTAVHVALLLMTVSLAVAVMVALGVRPLAATPTRRFTWARAFSRAGPGTPTCPAQRVARGRPLGRVPGLRAGPAPCVRPRSRLPAPRARGPAGFHRAEGGRYFVVYDGQRVGPAFDEISIAYCCEAMVYAPRGGYGAYRFWGRRGGQSYVVEVRTD